MGLSLEINLDKDIKEINQFFTELKFKAIVKSARQALNKTARSTRSFALKEIRKRRKTQLKNIKGFVSVQSARGNRISKLQAKVTFSGRKFPLIFFILGTKTPKAQTLPNPRRKSKRFEIVQGNKKAKAGLFIQKAARGPRQFEVFRRADPSDRSKGFRTQAAPSIVSMFQRKASMLKRIENRALNTMTKTYDQILQFELAKLKL